MKYMVETLSAHPLIIIPEHVGGLNGKTKVLSPLAVS